MIIFLYGQDSYRIKENLNKILEGYSKKNASGVNVYTPEAQNLAEETEQIVKTVGFFKEKKLILIRDVFASGQIEKMIELLERWKLDKDADIIVVFAEAVAGAVLAKKNKKLFALLEKKAQTIKEFEMLSSKKLENWIMAEFESLDKQIEPAALKKLLQYTTANIPKEGDPNLTWQLKQEIDKLTAGSGSRVTVIDVENLVIPEIRDQVFPITDALAEQNKIRYFSLLYGALDRGMDSGYIFSMLIYQFRNLLQLKSLSKEALAPAEVAKRSGLHPFVVRKTLNQASNYDLDDLKNWFHRFTAIEIATKSGRSDLIDELYNLAFF